MTARLCSGCRRARPSRAPIGGGRQRREDPFGAPRLTVWTWTMVGGVVAPARAPPRRLAPQRAPGGDRRRDRGAARRRTRARCGGSRGSSTTSPARCRPPSPADLAALTELDDLLSGRRGPDPGEPQHRDRTRRRAQPEQRHRHRPPGVLGDQRRRLDRHDSEQEPDRGLRGQRRPGVARVDDLARARREQAGVGDHRCTPHHAGQRRAERPPKANAAARQHVPLTPSPARRAGPGRPVPRPAAEQAAGDPGDPDREERGHPGRQRRRR